MDFRNTVVIMTSNLGSELWVGTNADDPEKKSVSRDQINKLLQAHFRPEFLNRVDEIVVFHPLTRSDLVEIVDIQLAKRGRADAGTQPEARSGPGGPRISGRRSVMTQTSAHARSNGRSSAKCRTRWPSKWSAVRSAKETRSTFHPRRRQASHLRPSMRRRMKPEPEKVAVIKINQHKGLTHKGQPLFY